jgi:hypothetical protein
MFLPTACATARHCPIRSANWAGVID